MHLLHPRLFDGMNLRHDTTKPMKAPWRDEAECLTRAEENFMTDAWINEHAGTRQEAIRICKEECEVRTACLVDALFDPQAEGILGGFPFSSGGLMSKDRRQLEREFPQFQNMARLRHKKDIGITNGGLAS